MTAKTFWWLVGGLTVALVLWAVFGDAIADRLKRRK